MSDKDTLTGFGIGFLAGAVIGLAVGFLYAPRSGEETRELIKEKASDVIEKVRETAAEAKRRAQEKLGRAEA